MEQIKDDRWTNPFWGLPYQSHAEKREWIRSNFTASEAARRYDAHVTAGNLDFLRLFKRRLPGRHGGDSSFPRFRRPVVKIKTYAHDRTVLSAFLEAPPIKGNPVSLQNLCKGLEGRRSLELLRETRRGCMLGNQWRSEPLPTNFTATARNMIRDVAHISEHDTKGLGLFMTFTLPGGLREAFDVFSYCGGYIVDRLNRWLRYKVSGGIFSYVWELQKRGAPHLHYCFRLPDTEYYEDFFLRAKMQWHKILLDLCEKTTVDVFARAKGGSWILNFDVLQVDARALDGTFARYMSKYMSKKESKAGGKTRWNPGRWWGVSYPGRQEALKRRLDTVLEIESEEKGLEVIPRLVAFVEPVLISAKGFSRIGYGHEDSVSMQVGTGGGAMLHKAICAAFLFGDWSDLHALAAGACGVSNRAALERKELNEHCDRKNKGSPVLKLVSPVC